MHTARRRRQTLGTVCVASALALTSSGLLAQELPFRPVTDRMLENPDPADWLMFSRTYDAQRYSPLDQIDTNNVGRLALAWARGMPEGSTETIPIVHDGVMYVAAPGASVQALDARTGDLLWEYVRPNAGGTRTKGLAIWEDMIYYTAPDSYVVAIDARTGELRWEAPALQRGHSSAPLVVDGKVISGGSCFGNRDNCFISGHDARTGEELWRFYTTPAPGEPGDDSWNGAAIENRQASTWGLPGSYDPARRLLYWGVANPMPDMRIQRHDLDASAGGASSPSDLYSNSTIALDPDTGELAWYYQHLPGDDADLDHTHERTLVRTALRPDPAFVKWINPAIDAGEVRDVAVTLPEGGGIFLNDRDTGEFLWATPFPFDSELTALADIDTTTGQTFINMDSVWANTDPGQKVVCYWNTRSYWPTAYHPGTNSLYTSWIDNCREMTMGAGRGGRGSWRVVQRPGGDPDQLTGLAKIDLATGEILKFDLGRAPGNGALLATSGNLVFHGDMSRRFRAFDAETGERLWETILGGNVSVSTITYAVDGRQYVAVMTGDNPKVPELLGVVPELELPRGHNEIYVFALP
jgi:alcohol dehydrogenase (cytochrome c)